MDDKYIEELFALPVKPTLEVVVDGQKFYSSPNLKKSFLKSIKSSKKTSKIYDLIENLVMKKKLIVPCFLTNNMFKFFKHKMFGSPQDKSILAFYHMTNKKVFILIDNNTTIFGTGKNNNIASTTIHECVHLYADGMRKKFLNTFKEELNRYYISYFSRLFKLKTKPKLNKVLNFLSIFEYQRSYQMNKQLTSFYKLLEEALLPHTTMNRNKFNKTLIDLIVTIKIYLTSFDSFLRIYKKYTHILKPLNKSYKDAFNKKNKYTTPYQELSSVSEVISVFSEINPTHTKIKKMFKDLS